jgi:hypothetical protein
VKKERELSRLAVARRLQEVALRIAAGTPVRVGGVAVQIPDRVIVEEELETRAGETERELELRGPAARAASPGRKAGRAASRRRKRKTS